MSKNLKNTAKKTSTVAKTTKKTATKAKPVTPAVNPAIVLAKTVGVTAATPKGKVTAASILKALRTQYTNMMAKSTKSTPATKKLEANIALAEEAVYAHRVRRTQRPAKAGREATRLGLTGVAALLATA